jgi:uncharacterized membrane protein
MQSWLAIFVPLSTIWVRHLHDGPLLWNLRGVAWVHTLVLVVSVLCWTVALASFVQPSPAGMVPGASPRAYGLTRITRHPLFMPLGIWAASHLLLNGFASDVAFFGGFALFSVVGCAHQDSRKRATEGDRLAGFFAETSMVPFAAILTGRTKFAAAELPLLPLGIAAFVALGLYHAHPFLFAP